MRDWTQWPTLATYLDWARSHGCSVVCSDATAMQPLRLVSITAPSGKVAVEVFVADDELLMSTTISRLDRRLGMKSLLFT